ncbi:MAG: hypothetical protein KGL39_43320 [Patescibacteria group bacterium]|nr:hypothetical protein [Patescibacteria group bacterium]
MPDLRWCVVQSHLRQEKLAFENLRRQGFEAYLPQHLARITPRGQPPRMVPQPLFPRYLFAHMDLELEHWRSLYSTRGVTAVLGNPERPSMVEERLVEELRARELSGLVRLEPGQIACRWKPGEPVTFGGFLDAIFHEPIDGRRASILVSLLGSDSLVTVDMARLA